MSLICYLCLATGKWREKVLEALGKRDLKPIEEEVFLWAFNKHAKLLKRNYATPLKRVKAIKDLQREYMQGLNLLHAAALAKIFETLREGEECYYLNLKITKQNGEIRIEDVGWNYLKEVEEK